MAKAAHTLFFVVSSLLCAGIAMKSMLLRQYVEHALYARGAGYFAAKTVVGKLHQPLPYKSLANEDAYRQAVRSRWEAGEFGSAWLTPCEMFTPFYGEAVARSIVERHKATYGASTPLQMLEVGGGNGTCARDVLHYLRREEPALYESCKYVLVEISPALAEAQHARLSHDLGRDDGPRFEVINEDALTWAEDRARRSPLEGVWWYNLFEVLDNLGHDNMRVADLREGGSECLELVITRTAGDGDEEEDEASEAAAAADLPLARALWEPSYRPLQDHDLIEASSLLRMQSAEDLTQLRAELAQMDGPVKGASAAVAAQQLLGSLFGMETDVAEVFVPTGCWRMLKALCRAAPQGHHFTMADFSYLPPHSDGAINHPVVQTQNKGRTIDLRGNYLMAAGEADIMFPTNFDHLATMVEAASAMTPRNQEGGSSPRGSTLAAAHMTSADFMRRWHPVSTTETHSGFNPLLDDFTNTRFLVS
jgi:hypothetical protein